MKRSFQAVFLDRDGVINPYPGKGHYVTSWKEFRFLPGALAALKKLAKTPFKIVVVSNQAGVGRKLMSQAALDNLTRRMQAQVREIGSRLDATYYCTHPPTRGCACRKPKTGMMKKARKRFRLDLKRSWMVGDNAIDIQMGHAAGCRTVLVLSGVIQRREIKNLPVKPDHVARNLKEAAGWILKQP